MIDCQVASEFPCIDSEYAEAVGTLSVLKRGKKLPVKIEKIDVVTDNLRNYEVLVGISDLTECKHPDIMKAILQAAKEYKVCRFRWEQRESLGFANALSKATKEHSLLDKMDLKAILQRNGPSRLWGMPIVRINQSEDFIKKGLSKEAKTFDPDLFASRHYYVTVQQQELKFEALEGLISVLDPKVVIVLVGSDKAAHQISLQLELSYELARELHS